MMHRKSIGIIIPLCNKGSLVRRALNSFIPQTFQDFEIVVVDDGSTGEGPDVVSQPTNPRIQLVQQVNAGAGAARNRGVDATHAETLPFSMQMMIDGLSFWKTTCRS